MALRFVPAVPSLWKALPSSPGEHLLIQNSVQKSPPVDKLPQLPQGKTSSELPQRLVSPSLSRRIVFTPWGPTERRFRPPPPTPTAPTKEKASRNTRERALTSSLQRLSDPLEPGHVSRRPREILSFFPPEK